MTKIHEIESLVTSEVSKQMYLVVVGTDEQTGRQAGREAGRQAVCKLIAPVAAVSCLVYRVTWVFWGTE